MTTQVHTPADRGASLRDKRTAAGLTIPQLAGLADCSTTGIRQIEEGYRPKRSPLLAHLYDVLDDLDSRRA